MENENRLDLIDRGALVSEISKIGMVSVGNVLGCLSNAPTVEAVEVETVKAWLYQIAMNNVGIPVEDFSVACEEIISRLDGLRKFAGERREGE